MFTFFFVFSTFQMGFPLAPLPFSHPSPPPCRPRNEFLNPPGAHNTLSWTHFIHVNFTQYISFALRQFHPLPSCSFFFSYLIVIQFFLLIRTIPSRSNWNRTKFVDVLHPSFPRDFTAYPRTRHASLPLWNFDCPPVPLWWLPLFRSSSFPQW